MRNETGPALGSGPGSEHSNNPKAILGQAADNSDKLARFVAARAEFEARRGPEVLQLMDAASEVVKAVRRNRRRRRTRNRRRRS